MKQKRKIFDIYKPVFIPAAIIILSLVVVSFIFSEDIVKLFGAYQESASNKAGWFFILSVNIFVVAALFIAFSKFGNIRLGGQAAKPDFNTFSWFSMLFSAGVGIGLLFYGVAEPMYHYGNPPLAQAETYEVAKQAMLYTYLHWGLHGWGAYVIIGLALAFFTFNRKMPLTIRSIFYPLFGDRVYGPLGHVIDVIAVVATLFGLATSLGIGVKQVATGLNHLFGISAGTGTQVSLIAIITLFATTSVILGLDKGVRFLSVVNMRLAVVFLLFVLVLGPTVFLLDGFVQNLGEYLNNILSVGTWTETYSGKDWQNDWTIFYWAWWISWSPFVGMFIARVSKGRTIREFILGVLLVPSCLIFLWMSVFGGTAIWMEMNGIGEIAKAVDEDLSKALFVMLKELPLSSVTSFIGIVLVTIFFVTSSDSGSLVIDSITSGGKLDAPIGQRIFWALTEGLVAAVLLYAGGLEALQSVVLSAGLPFCIIVLIIIYSLYRGLQNEYRELMTKEKKLEKEEYVEQIQKLLEKHDDRS